MRHSKAGQTNKNILDDHERPLTLKGEQLCEKVADSFANNIKDFKPSIILSSTALRARQTANLFKKYYKSGKDIPIETHQELYITNDEEILNIIRSIDDKHQSALLISHNPGLLNFALKFANKGDKNMYRELKSNFPPGSYIAYEIDEDEWQNVKHQEASLLFYQNSKKAK
jgi:phosphohistidine phosphatase